MKGGRYNLGAFLLAAALLTPAVLPPASAQGLSGSGSGPLQIEAEEGLEWRRDEQLYIARGNAKATRGQLTVHADELIARYRKTDGSEGGGDAAGTDSGATAGDTEIFRIDAVGNVRIVGENETAYGDRGTYDIDQAVVVLTGEDLRFEAREETITAEDSLEYWRAKNMAVARGDAVALQGERRIAADVLTAYFGEAGEDGQRGVDRIEAFDNVRISTKEEFASGDKGVYNAKTEIARLYGDVKLTRGDNQLNGGYAEVNLKTGISKLMGGPPNAAERNRVKALLKPEGKGSEMPDEVGSGDGSQ